MKELPDLNPKELAHYMIDTIVEHFSADPINRRCKNTDNCYYSPKSLDSPHPDNIGCAIGMFLKPEVKEGLDREFKELKCGSTVSYIQYKNEQLKTFKDIPQRLWSVDIKFLSRFQSLHDEDDHWADNKMSESGLRFVRDIKQAIDKEL